MDGIYVHLMFTLRLGQNVHSIPFKINFSSILFIPYLIFEFLPNSVAVPLLLLLRCFRIYILLWHVKIQPSVKSHPNQMCDRQPNTVLMRSRSIKQTRATKSTTLYGNLCSVHYIFLENSSNFFSIKSNWSEIKRIFLKYSSISIDFQEKLVEFLKA